MPLPLVKRSYLTNYLKVYNERKLISGSPNYYNSTISTASVAIATSIHREKATGSGSVFSIFMQS